MKNLTFTVIAFAFLALSLTLNAQSEDMQSLTKMYQSNDAVTNITIGPAIFGILSRMSDEEDSQAIKEAISDFQGIQILSYAAEEGEPGAQTFYEDAKSVLGFGDFSELMTIESHDEIVEFLIQEEGDLVSNLLMVVRDDLDCVVMQIKGDINLHALSRVSGDIDIYGFDQLEKMDCDRAY